MYGEDRYLRWGKERQRNAWQQAEQARLVALIRQRGREHPAHTGARRGRALLQALRRGVQAVVWAGARRPSTGA